MKFVVEWTARPGSDPKENLKGTDSLLQAFGSWTAPAEWTISTPTLRVILSSGAVTSTGRGAAEPNDARSSSPADTESETTAITIALRGPIFMNVCGSFGCAR